MKKSHSSIIHVIKGFLVPIQLQSQLSFIYTGIWQHTKSPRPVLLYLYCIVSVIKHSCKNDTTLSEVEYLFQGEMVTPSVSESLNIQHD
jgi:hypothetical protein